METYLSDFLGKSKSELLEPSRNLIVQKSIQKSHSMQSACLYKLAPDQKLCTLADFWKEWKKIIGFLLSFGTLIPKKAQIKAGETKQGVQESRLTQATRSEILHSSRIQKGWKGVYARVNGSRSMEPFSSSSY